MLRLTSVCILMSLSAPSDLPTNGFAFIYKACVPVHHFAAVIFVVKAIRPGVELLPTNLITQRGQVCV